ncbi:MAG: trypsin-like peptidase domain-containing protein [Paludibacter sp.]|nr:trypsin-like peptidase domain-containing protein [Bacteroidales bacterium]MCM1068770.1 trypsin-like peptidase domain-containing protein [Prevotella sp.]MCM1354482.1 trypsin-like peptidase domain-containing protein [Bacteroides sp.]MCM1443285.1 trypsin-like peptidase domain-containing protein [Muribaculum sp.]MCM1481030.1 trypsin-like peptidase domain-containing protein [Paludibacter sp.]
MKLKTFILVLTAIFSCCCTRRSNNFGNHQDHNNAQPKESTIKSVNSGSDIVDISTNLPSVSERKYIGTEIFDKYNSAVFMIFTSDGLNEFQGSGFFIDSDGLAVSNYHVFEGTGIGLETIKLSNGRIYKIKNIIAQNKDYDFIIFKVDINQKCNYIPMTNRHNKIGEKIFTIGSPMGLENTFSSGEISQLRGEYIIQINAPIDHGSSGGALINEYGEVIGITSSGYDNSNANLNFAIDICIIKSSINSHNTASAYQWTQEELINANTADNIEELTRKERDVIKFLNLARLYPQRFIQIELRSDRVKRYSNSSYLTSLIEELSVLQPLNPFYFNEEMQAFAECWAIESGKHAILGHDREGYCTDGFFAECCSYGPQTAEEIVVGLLVDYNIPSLGHRKTLLGNYNSVGVAIASHKSKYQQCCVIDLKKI